LAEPILRALEAEGYSTPTPIQAKAIPPVMEGRDVLGSAQTGTGKTAAFALPILHRLSQKPRPATTGSRKPRVLVLSPTRELSAQIDESFRTYGRHLQLRSTVVFGGVSQYRQEQALRQGVDVVVATPGRLLDLVQQNICDLRHIEVFVLDEADQMLDMGFIHDIRKIVTRLPAQRQNLLFSATMPNEIRELAHTILKNPATVQVAPVSRTADRVEQSVYFVEKRNKASLLVHYLNEKATSRVLVFSRTKHGADKIARFLERSGIKAAAIHGNKNQNARNRALAAFKSNAPPVLVATDIAARGLDIDEVSHVVNFDVPNVPETYVHRIGRTARAGASGVAVSFCDGEERAYLRDIEQLTRQKIPVSTDHPEYPAPAATVAAPLERHQQQPARSSQHRPAATQPRHHSTPHAHAPRPAHSNPAHSGGHRSHGPSQSQGGGRPQGNGGGFRGAKRPRRFGRHPMAGRPR
jgi:ATP-dependent RNA helicase RhlE